MGILRLLLAMSVLAAHAGAIFGFTFVGSQLAVETFFMISGFYMALILQTKYNSYSLFITNRVFKIYPLYWIILLLTVISSILIGFYSKGASHGQLSIYFLQYKNLKVSTIIFLVITNIIILFQDFVMFTGIHSTNGSLFLSSNFGIQKIQTWQFLLIPPAWSISLELFFYFFVPFLIKKSTFFLTAFILISLLLKYILLTHYNLSNDPWTYRFFPCEIAYFLAGIISYRIHLFLKSITIYKPILFFIFFIVIYSTIFYKKIFNYNQLDFFVYQIILFIGIPFIFILTKDWKFDREIGDLSYPLYLSHWLVIGLLSGFTNRFHYNLSNGLTVFIISVTMSVFINKLVLRKIELFRQKRVLKYQNILNKVIS